jgi:hypothetical protein
VEEDTTAGAERGYTDDQDDSNNGDNDNSNNSENK